MSSKEMFLMTVEIGNGKKDQIVIYQSDDPYEIAKQFCDKHHLEESTITNLVQHIQANIENVHAFSRKSSASLPQPKKITAGQKLSKEEFLNQWKLDCQANLKKVDQTRPKIDKQSRKIARSSLNSTESVFQRLQRSNAKIFVQASSTENVNSNAMKKSIDSYNNNRYVNSQEVGDRLYYNGIQKKMDLNRKIEEIKIMQEQKEHSLLTFKPVVNNIKPVTRKNQKVEQGLIERGKMSIHSREKGRTLKTLDENRRFLYSPQIIEKSKHMLTNRRTGNVFENLYIENQDRTERMEQLCTEMDDPECIFSPNIGLKEKEKESQGEFIARLANSNLEKLEKVEELKKERETEMYTHDPVTGQEYFRPQILTENVEREQPVYLELYTLHGEIQAKLEEKRLDDEEQTNSNTLMNSSNQKSQQMTVKAQEYQLKQIFLSLDSDNDDSINAQNIDITKIPPKILKVIKPVLEQMEKKKSNYSSQQFIEAMKKFSKKLCFSDRIILFPKGRSKTAISEESTFRPQINSHMQVTTGPVLDRLYKAMEDYKSKKVLKKQELERQELDCCTFKPRTLPVPNYIVTHKTITDAEDSMDFNDMPEA